MNLRRLLILALFLAISGCTARLPTRGEVRLSNDLHTSVAYATVEDGQTLRDYAAERTVMLIDGPNWRIVRGKRGGRRYFTPGDVASAGVVISEDGYVLTSAHGVDSGRLMAVLPGWQSGPGAVARPRTARVVWSGFGSSPAVDIALVKIDLLPRDEPLAFIEAQRLAADPPREGMPLLLTGIAPDAGHDGTPPELATAAGDVLSIRAAPGVGHLVRVDAPVRPGFSGGPALTIDARLAGITTQLTASMRLTKLLPLPMVEPRFTSRLVRPDADLITRLIDADRRRVAHATDPTDPTDPTDGT